MSDGSPIPTFFQFQGLTLNSKMPYIFPNPLTMARCSSTPHRPFYSIYCQARLLLLSAQSGGAKSRFSDKGVPVTQPPMDQMT